MVLTVKHKIDGSIYYVTKKMFDDAKGLFILVENEVEEVDLSDPVEEEYLQNTEEDRLEVLRGVLRDRGIPFHPNTGEKKLREKLEEYDNSEGSE